MRLFQREPVSVGSWESQQYFTSASGAYSRIALNKQNQGVQWARLDVTNDRVVIGRSGLYLLFAGAFLRNCPRREEVSASTFRSTMVP